MRIPGLVFPLLLVFSGIPCCSNSSTKAGLDVVPEVGVPDDLPSGQDAVPGDLRFDQSADAKPLDHLPGDLDLLVPDARDEVACVPDCKSRVCGDDGCLGSCGQCPAGQECGPEGLCQCAPKCEGKLCGDDGCGGTCGQCSLGRCEGGVCTSLCTPDCAGRSCGGDGCGGNCGLCLAGTFCSPTGVCEEPAISPDWVCASSAWSDGAICDCSCGDLDPDCWSDLALPVTGCLGGQTCAAGGVCAVSLPEWTLMFFLSGDNNLEYFIQEDLDEIEATPVSPKAQILVLVDTRSGPTQVFRALGGALEVVGESDELDLADWRVLSDFGRSMVARYPAKRYGLVLSDHGSGWRAPQKSMPDKGLSNDNSGQTYEMSVAKGDLAFALEQIVLAAGQKLDFIGFDACLMGSLEVASAVEPYAEWMIGSEETEPGSGWDLGPVLKAIALKPEMDAVSLASLILEKYYEKSAANSTLALVNLQALSSLNSALSGLALSLFRNPSSNDLFATLRAETQGFNVNEETHEAVLKDLGDLAARVVAAGNLPEDVREEAQALLAVLPQVVVENAVQDDYSAATGLSIYIPDPLECMNHLYALGAGATWARTGLWDDYITMGNQFDCGVWVCDGSWFGGHDGCDCNCGAWDPDCDESPGTVYHCLPGQNCAQPGVCAGEPIPLCAQWTCTPSFFGGNDGCDCGCGCWDPDCSNPDAQILHCLNGQYCAPDGTCAGDPVQVCDTWTCETDYFGAADGCDCECGCWDPDCDIPGAKIWHCDPGQVCQPPLGTCG